MHDSGASYGYADPLYAQAFAGYGTPRDLRRSGGWVLIRPIPEGEGVDAMGGYPLFTCPRWDSLADDLAELDNEIVSLSLVADPFGAPPQQILRSWFPDICVPFKEHFVVDLGKSRHDFVDPHHRRNARKALKHTEVTVMTNPVDGIADWMQLYEALCRRHEITGMRAFSRQSFDSQLQVPGMVAMQARVEGKLAGMILWIRNNDVAYYHLAGYTEVGYRNKVSFALFWSALEFFTDQVEWLSLGAAAGLNPEADDGLTRFKRGWATGTRTAYFCGRISDRERYAALISATCSRPTSYFPAYRSGEFI